jgi:PAS domain S-box-containing protein
MKKMTRGISVSLGFGFIALFLVTLKSYAAESLLYHPPLHSAMEAVGGVTALLLSYLLRISQHKPQRGYVPWAQCALISIGTLDLFHSAVPPGEDFVWLHSIATLSGGVFFSLVWVDQRRAGSKTVALLPGIVLLVSVAGGLASLLFVRIVPHMLSQAGFTWTAVALNVLGGLLFLAASAWFIKGYRTYKRRRDDVFFAGLCLLLASAGMIFPFSRLWDQGWWIWHIVRLVAYALAMYYIFNVYHRSLRAQQESQAHFRIITETATDAIVCIDRNKKVIQWNNAAFEMFGYTADEAIGKELPFIMAEEVRAAHEEGIRRVLTTGETRLIGGTYESVGRRRDGAVFPVEISLARWQQGKETYFAGIMRDITKRKKSEEELKATLAELERSNKDLEQFAYIASHDLQEPLRTISGFVQLIRERYQDRLDEKANKFIAFIVEATERMHEMIKDMLAFSRIGTSREAFGPVESQQALDRAISQLGRKFEETGAKVTHSELPIVTGDILQLTQLLQNLIDNALNFRRETPPEIHIDAALRGHEWFFSVRDNGIGFDPKYADKLFIIFQRLHGRKDYAGSGIGLAVCKKIVERHGGRIWAESTPGNGATFHFTLPERK